MIDYAFLKQLLNDVLQEVGNDPAGISEVQHVRWSCRECFGVEDRDEKGRGPGREMQGVARRLGRVCLSSSMVVFCCDSKITVTCISSHGKCYTHFYKIKREKKTEW